jgi:hypothetical protein
MAKHGIGTRASPQSRFALPPSLRRGDCRRQLAEEAPLLACYVSRSYKAPLGARAHDTLKCADFSASNITWFGARERLTSAA